jgi:cytochrome c-type biogenesis protein CcmE
MRHSARAIAAGVLAIAGTLGFLVYQGLSNNLVYYITPSELLAKGAVDGHTYRLGGQVQPGSRHWNARSQTLRFVLQDPRARIAVVSHGLPPAMFREGVGVVVEGTYAHHHFEAVTLMVKHCAAYRAPVPGRVPPPDNCVT